MRLVQERRDGGFLNPVCQNKSLCVRWGMAHKYLLLTLNGLLTLPLRRRPHQLLDLAIEITRNGQRFGVPIGRKKACHLVIAEMYAV